MAAAFGLGHRTAAGNLLCPAAISYCSTLQGFVSNRLDGSTVRRFDKDALES